MSNRSLWGNAQGSSKAALSQDQTTKRKVRKTSKVRSLQQGLLNSAGSWPRGKQPSKQRAHPTPNSSRAAHQLLPKGDRKHTERPKAAWAATRKPRRSMGKGNSVSHWINLGVPDTQCCERPNSLQTFVCTSVGLGFFPLSFSRPELMVLCKAETKQPE